MRPPNACEYNRRRRLRFFFLVGCHRHRRCHRKNWYCQLSIYTQIHFEEKQNMLNWSFVSTMPQPFVLKCIRLRVDIPLDIRPTAHWRTLRFITHFLCSQSKTKAGAFVRIRFTRKNPFDGRRISKSSTCIPIRYLRPCRSTLTISWCHRPIQASSAEENCPNGPIDSSNLYRSETEIN